MAMLYISPQTNSEEWRTLMRAEIPDLDFRIAPETGDPGEIEAVLVWGAALEKLKDFPNLKMIASMGAGVDHVMANRHLVPEGVPLTRLVDPAMTAQMTEWCVMATLNHLRRWDDYRALHRERRWEELEVPIPWDTTIGVLGLGELGGDCARVLAAMGYRVRGWSRSAKKRNDIACFHGLAALEEFLAPCDVVISLLPLTPETEDLLDARAFGWMKRGAHVINAARGRQIVDQDLIAAIDSGHLSGATLDVQRTEPMPDDHPFWFHPKIMTFAHVAALTVPRTCVPQIAENYRRMKAGKPLENVVDLARGY
jgi:glyoxylate/hydroxypyruvate reductase A